MQSARSPTGDLRGAAIPAAALGGYPAACQAARPPLHGRRRRWLCYLGIQYYHLHCPALAGRFVLAGLRRARGAAPRVQQQAARAAEHPSETGSVQPLPK
eukprot:COSAG06_NODE_149_length_22026_cov_33.454782_6_plen_100_part_00